MLAIIYQFRLHQNQDIDEYKRLWRQLATYFMRECGALGACLHRADDDWWVIYSRWPDQQTRQQFWLQPDSEVPASLPPAIKAVMANMRALVADRKPEWALEVVDDMLLPGTSEPVLF